MSRRTAKQYLGIDVYQASKERARQAMRMFDNFCVSFSGGKDSTAVLNVVRDVAREEGRLPVRVIFIDEECIPYEIESYVRRLTADPDFAIEWYTVPVRHRNAASRKEPWWWPWDPDIPEKWVRPKPPEGIDLPGFPMQPASARFSVPDSIGLFFQNEQRYQNSVMFLGLRAAESLRRWQAIANRSSDEMNFVVKNPRTRVAVPGYPGTVYFAYPIYDWTVWDVWRAILDFGWDYSEAYNRMTAQGITLFSQRIAPPFGEEPIGGLYKFKAAFPDVWEKMADRVDGANAASMYGRSELYMYGKSPKLGEDPDIWKAYLMDLIQKQEDPQARASAAVSIRQSINAHYKNTTQPILARAQHPSTGLSWEKLCKLAARGNLKGRATNAAPPSKDTPAYRRLTREYDDAYRRFIMLRTGRPTPELVPGDAPESVEVGSPDPLVLELV